MTSYDGQEPLDSVELACKDVIGKTNHGVYLLAIYLYTSTRVKYT